MQTTEWQELEQIQKIAQEYADHLMEDDKAKVMEVPSAIMGGKPPAPAQQPQVPMPPGLTPAGGSQPPMPAGGNQQSGMAPQGGQQPQGGQSQVPQQGRPPMAAM